MAAVPETHQWYKDNYLLSTSQALLQIPEINAALGTDAVYWAKSLPEADIRTCIANSLCFGLYALPASSSEIAGMINPHLIRLRTTLIRKEGRSGPKLIGFGRIVTDYVTLGYLTDVYVLPEHQGKGLARWMMECIWEVLGQWPHLRRLLLYTRGQKAAAFYKETLQAQVFQQNPDGLIFLNSLGKGCANV